MCSDCLGMLIIYPDTQTPVPCPTCLTGPLQRVRELVTHAVRMGHDPNDCTLTANELRSALLGEVATETQLARWECPECGKTGEDDPRKSPMTCWDCYTKPGEGKWVDVEWKEAEETELEREVVVTIREDQEREIAHFQSYEPPAEEGT